ncbi:MAG: DUF2442 domain-containing protein [Spirochaetales bacterium]|nr:DUF2442 domain-containing protein [Spirochaetales bacterium]
MTEIEISNAVKVEVDDKTLTVTLDDGRILSLPISWYPRLYYGSQQERNNFRLIGKGEGIHWEDLDEDISMEGIIAGHHSQESQVSLAKWLKARG